MVMDIIFRYSSPHLFYLLFSLISLERSQKFFFKSKASNDIKTVSRVNQVLCIILEMHWGHTKAVAHGCGLCMIKFGLYYTCSESMVGKESMSNPSVSPKLCKNS